MRNVFIKEIRLAASPLSFWFTFFGLMFLLPGYPVLCGAFFVTLGIFQSFQSVRENNDILFSVLLPVSKRDIVGGKFLFVCFIEACGFTLMAAATVLRMTVFCCAAAYRNNALMNANFFALGAAAVIFGVFNYIFVGGFFKTAYKFAGPFIKYIIVSFLCVCAAETAHHIPGLSFFNAFGTESIGLQAGLLAAGVFVFLIFTAAAYKISCRRFERIDL